MRVARLGLGVAVAAACLTGCQGRWAGIRQELGPAAEIGTAAMQNLGWDSQAGKLRKVGFSAVVTTYDKNGKSYTDLQKMVVDLKKDTLTAVGRSPQGPWRATAYDDGKFKLKAKRPVDKYEVTRRMAPTLATLLHRLRGPYNLVGHHEHARSAEAALIDGARVVRVSVDGDNRKAVAYYFDAATGMLRFVTAGADRPGRKGTVTVYRYAALPNGMAFPKLIKVARLGTHVLVGEEAIFQVEISGMRLDLN